MMKRSFFSLTQPTLTYDPIESDPKEPELIPMPSNLVLLLNEPIDSTRNALIKKGDSVERGEKITLYEDSSAYVISPVTGTIETFDTYSDDFGNTSTYLVVKNNQSQTADTKTLTIDLKRGYCFCRRISQRTSRCTAIQETG
jgi:electron transport complex protein RnfC